jgi:hypothetical protein
MSIRDFALYAFFTGLGLWSAFIPYAIVQSFRNRMRPTVIFRFLTISPFVFAVLLALRMLASR